MKDPAFLFYSADYLVGVLGMSWEDQGRYMFIMATMHQKGRLKEETIRFLVGSISDSLKSKFEIDDQGNWYQKRLETEISNRANFVNSRRMNGKKGGRPSNDSAPEAPINDPPLKPDGEPNAKPIGYANDKAGNNLTINVIEIENVINKLKNRNLAEKLFELFKTKKWCHKSLNALNQTIKKAQTFDPEFMIKQIDNAMIGEWSGLFFENTEAEHEKFLKQNSKKSQHRNGINLDKIKYGTS